MMTVDSEDNPIKVTFHVIQVEDDSIACILWMSSRAPVQRDKASARVWRKRGRGPTMSPLPAIVYTWLIILAHLRALILARPVVLQVSHQVYSSRSPPVQQKYTN